MSTILIDQSGKVEKTNVVTVVAAANKKSFAVLLPSAIKRRLAEQIGKGNVKEFSHYPVVRIFVICAFLSLRHLGPEDAIIIDYEYKGHEHVIKSQLLDLIRNRYPQYKKEKITFVEIGKNVYAHKLANKTYRGLQKPNKVITENELLAIL